MGSQRAIKKALRGDKDMGWWKRLRLKEKQPIGTLKIKAVVTR